MGCIGRFVPGEYLWMQFNGLATGAFAPMTRRIRLDAFSATESCSYVTVFDEGALRYKVGTLLTPDLGGTGIPVGVHVQIDIVAIANPGILLYTAFESETHNDPIQCNDVPWPDADASYPPDFRFPGGSDINDWPNHGLVRWGWESGPSA